MESVKTFDPSLRAQTNAAPIKNSSVRGDGNDAEKMPAEFSFLGLLSAEDRARLEQVAQPVAFAFGDTIIRQGEAGDKMYVMLSGHARVVQISPDGEESFIAMLQPGDVIGEIAVLRNQTRNATVRASGRVRALHIDRVSLLKLINERPQIGQWLEHHSRGRILFSFLRRVPAFRRLPPQVIWALMKALKPASAVKGQQVVIEGDTPGPMYIVEEGRLRVVKADGDKVVNLAFLREGDFFGEASLLRREPRAATVEALSDVKLYALGTTDFLYLIQQWPEFKRAVEERVSGFDFAREARVPLDFDVENLPAQAMNSLSRLQAVETAEDPASLSSAKNPFATPEGHFRKKSAPWSFSFIAQIDEMDCGAASLAMICRHFGRNISLARIRSLAHTETDGTSLGNLCLAANELGLAARAVKVSHKNLDKLPTPAIVHWDNYHWVVLVEVRRRKVRIADPAQGVHWVPRAEFEARWNGFCGLFDYTKEFAKQPNQKSASFAWIAPFVWPYAGVILQSFLLAVVGAMLTLALPVLTQVIVDRVVVEGARDVLSLALVAMAGTFTFLAACGMLQGYLLAFVAVRVDAATLDFLTRKLLALPLSYFQTRRTGDIQRRLDGARQIRQMMVSSGVAGLLAIFQFIVAVIVMTVYSPLLAGVYLGVAPLYAGLMFFSARFLKPLFDRLEETQSKYRSEQLDAIKGIEAVKAAGAEVMFRDRLLDRFLDTAGQQFSADFTVLAYKSAVQGVGFLTSLIFLWFGARLTMEGQLTLGGFVAFTSLVAMANAPLNTMLGLWDSLQMMQVLMNRLTDVFEQEPEQGRDRSRLLPVRTLSGALEFRNIGFSYEKDGTPILKGINLRVPAGQTIAIVGRSGSGKTTLAKLLSGLLESTEGEILFDGVKQSTLNLRDLRRKIGYVLQENHIFAGSILENIAFGEEPNLERAISAARMANAAEFIERLPLSYETRIGESGIALSGGQRQRIAIARAIYRNPAVLVFDEATSALDTDSERAIQENLRSFFAGRTVFVIAHRLSTIRDADRIIVLEKGEIVENGTHDELMDRHGVYFYLVNRQVES